MSRRSPRTRSASSRPARSPARRIASPPTAFARTEASSSPLMRSRTARARPSPEVASAIAISLQAEKLVLLTNVQGVMRDPNQPESLMSTLKHTEIDRLIKKGVIAGGMIPKVNSSLEALNGGVGKAHIIDARLRHALLLEIFTDRGIGTQIVSA